MSMNVLLSLADRFHSSIFIVFTILGNYALYCYEQSWYKYQICIGACVLIYKNLRDRVVDRGG